MSIITRFKSAVKAYKSFYAYAAQGGKEATYTLLSPSILDVIKGQYADQNLITLFHCVPEIFAPVHAIASRVADAVVQLKKTADDSLVYDNKDINRLLSQPNPLQNLKELVYEWVVYEIITGKNFLYANVPDTLSFDYKNVRTLLNLWADQVSIVPVNSLKLLSATSVNDLIKHYKLKGLDTPILPERVLYTYRLNLDKGKPFEGQSPLRSADKAIANLIAVYEARNVIYVKRGALGWLVSKKSDASGNVALTKNEKQSLLDEQQKTYGVRGDKSPIGISDAPIDFVRTSMSIQELEPFKETQADALAIASTLNVDKDLLPLPEGTTFENKKGAERSLYSNVAIPMARKIIQSLTNFLQLEKAGLYLDVTFDHIEVLQENKKEKSEVFKNNVGSYSLLYEKGVITKNEFLVGCGYEAIEGGDVYITDVKNDTPLAVRLGVGGTQALQSILADTNLSEDQKRNTLMILFGLPEDQARALSVGGGVNSNTNPNPSGNAETTN